jgi:hypothetical protein
MHGEIWLALAMTMMIGIAADEQPKNAEAIRWQTMPGQTASGEFPGWKCFSENKHVDVADIWQEVDGRLVCKGSSRGYLYTTADHTNFILQLQWRWPSKQSSGKGGVLLRMTGPHKIWPKSLEAQINAGDAGDFWGLDGFHLTGPASLSKTVTSPDFGVLTNVRKMRSMEKPAGQWNNYEIRAEQEIVTLRINGVIVNRATRCEVTPGKICLTSEGTPIEFRQIRWRSLDTK